MKRRDFLKQAGIGSATVVSLPALTQALTRPPVARSPLDAGGELGNTFSVLLSGLYKPVAKCPNLGLSVNVCDGSYSTTQIYPISGLPVGESDTFNRGNRPSDFHCETANAIGDFYVALGGMKPVAYDLPRGALSMVFTGRNVQQVPDGEGGIYIVGTFDLDITEATGVYQPFVGGHNKMVDILHRLANEPGQQPRFIEHCVCIISRP
jgi:hypothetical protein